MEELKEIYRNRLKTVPMEFKRRALSEIHWEARLVGIRGARGTGKTTLLLQRLKEIDRPAEETLFASLDNLYFSEHKLYHTTRDFVRHGGRYLFLDEVHKYPNWSQELKNIYDDFPELSVAFTGSSLLSLKDGNADLSRRVVMHELQGLSLGEYAELSRQIALPRVSLDDILHHGDEISDEVVAHLKPLQLYDEYVRFGYYPFVMEGRDFYYQRLTEVVNYVIEAELPQLRSVDKGMIAKVKQLLFIISQSAPFTPNVTKLGERIGISRVAMLNYLQDLQESRLTINLSKPNKGISALQKPDKIYMENPNLMYALAAGQVNSGNVRETFFANQFSGSRHSVAVSPVSDFLIDGQLTFEIGGQGKDSHQIAGLANAYVAADNIEYGSGSRLPLWQFGLL